MRAMRQRTDRTARMLDRVRAEYLGCPGLNLTESQLRRFMDADEAEFAELLHRLVESGFLERTETGQYILPRMAATHGH
jgi:DNA-binding IclR family transcriptional regulator